MMKIVALVPIKLNNERLPGKNLKPFKNGKPLLSYIIDTLNSISLIDERYVFCSDESICSYLYGDIKFLKREDYLDLPNSNFTQIFDSFIKKIKADIYVYAHATAPFIKKETIERCIIKVLNEDYDSAFTVKEICDFVWYDNKPNYDLKNIPRTQDILPIYIETSGIYIFKKDVFLNYKQRIGDKPYICTVSPAESIDINYPEDFAIANAMILDDKNLR